MPTIDVSGSSAQVHSGAAAVVVHSPALNDDIVNSIEVYISELDIDDEPIVFDFSTIAATRESGEDVLGGNDNNGGLTRGTVWFRIVNGFFESDEESESMGSTPVPEKYILTLNSTEQIKIEVWSFPADEFATSADFATLAGSQVAASPDPGFSRLPIDGTWHSNAVVLTIPNPTVASWEVEVGKEYYVRVHELGWSTEPLDGEISLTVTTPHIDMTLAKNKLDWTPNYLVYSISGGTPNGLVRITVDGVTLSGYPNQQLTSDGDLKGATAPVPFLTSGTHRLKATDLTTGYNTGDDGLFLVNDKFAYFDDPIPPGFILPTVPDPRPDGVLPFFLTDPGTSETYSFPRNPTVVGTMARQRNVQTGRTLAPDGTAQLWEGGPMGRTVTLSGTVFSQDDLDYLRYWATKTYRVFMSDEIGRQWIVMLRNVQSTPKRDVLNPQIRDYKLTLLLLGRVSDLDIPDTCYPGPHVYPSEELYPCDPDEESS